jgi:ADP-ribose pyrophosphatase
MPDGSRMVRDVVRHPGAVVILPLTASKTILLVRQYRHPIGQWILELPAGTLEPGEEPLACAQREICEEVGFAARAWQKLGELYPAPGFCDERQRLYLAQDLYEKSLPCDDDEQIEVEEIGLSEVPALIRGGAIQDAKTIAALFHAQLLGIVSW